jgi:uncharacterized membrane protein
MKLNVKQEDFKFIVIGLIPTLFIMYAVYLLAYLFWWIPFVVVFLPLSYGIGVMIEPNVYVAGLQIKVYLKKLLTNENK